MTEKRPGVALACFDFDGTMLRGDSIVRYLRTALRCKALSLGEYLRVCGHTALFLAHLESDAQVKNRALRFRKALSPERQLGLDAAFARDVLVPKVYPQARACLAEHRAAGRKTVLVTASTENYMAFVARELGFDAVLATPVEADGSIRHNCKGEEKVRRLLSWLQAENLEADFAASYAYGDSTSDLPLLRMVGHPVQVNPKGGLRKAAPDMPRQQWGAP